jgi:2-polyprenyl-3-methyl-5-hydroxy-6-metoxy-1,4-benzoquinol methylase
MQNWVGLPRMLHHLFGIFFESTPLGQNINKPVLDLCCGTGQLKIHFLEKSYKVVGIDLSEHKLHFAREDASQYMQSCQAEFVKDDANSCALNERFGLVLPTYDALNHLQKFHARNHNSGQASSKVRW